MCFFGISVLEHFNWLFKLVEHVLTNQVYFKIQNL